MITLFREKANYPQMIKGVVCAGPLFDEEKINNVIRKQFTHLLNGCLSDPVDKPVYRRSKHTVQFRRNPDPRCALYKYFSSRGSSQLEGGWRLIRSTLHSTSVGHALSHASIISSTASANFRRQRADGVPFPLLDDFLLMRQCQNAYEAVHKKTDPYINIHLLTNTSPTSERFGRLYTSNTYSEQIS